MNLARLRRRSNGRSAQRFRCAKLIAHCCELGGKDRGGLVAECGMGPLGVVGVDRRNRIPVVGLPHDLCRLRDPVFRPNLSPRSKTDVTYSADKGEYDDEAEAALFTLALLAAVSISLFEAGRLDSEAFVAAFGEVCVPERLSYEGTLALAEELGRCLLLSATGGSRPSHSYVIEPGSSRCRCAGVVTRPAGYPAPGGRAQRPVGRSGASAPPLPKSSPA